MKLRKWINRFLEGTHNHFSCFFPGNSGFSSSILKLFFSGVKVRKNQSLTIEEIPENAIIVYATKHKSKFDYLFYHTRYKLYGLPYPEIGFDYKVILWQPVARIFKISSFDVCAFLIVNLTLWWKHFKLSQSIDFFNWCLFRLRSYQNRTLFAIFSLGREKMDESWPIWLVFKNGLCYLKFKSIRLKKCLSGLNLLALEY